MFRRPTTFFLVLVITVVVFLNCRWGWQRLASDFRNFCAGDIVDFTFSDNITGFGYAVVPNLVHFVHLGSSSLSFVEAICIRAAWIQQRPDKLWIHCDMCHTIREGTYWPFVQSIPGLEIRSIRRPRYVFGKRLSSIYHASDVVRLKILLQHGGIFLDGDSYLVRSLDPFRHFEMSLGWPPQMALGTQVLVAHKNSRFLRLWYESYRYYRPQRWYWNAGQLPTEMFLVTRPQLVHRVPWDFGVHDVTRLLYAVCSNDWRRFYSIHLLFRHRHYLVANSTSLDERSIVTYNKTFGHMARLALYGTTRQSSIKNAQWFLHNQLEYGGCD
ncbi:uncharacterized protein LOC135395522 [Ornithodoros turicata]